MNNDPEISLAKLEFAIQATRKKFGDPPRTFGFFDRMYLKIKPPAWMRDNNDVRFLELYEKQDLLFREGSVVWGHAIQANLLLFNEGHSDHPADIIYSIDPVIDRRPGILGKAADFLYSQKGKSTDQDLQQFSDKLEDEYVADWKIPIPTRLTEGIECFFIATMIIRKHLPRKFLSRPLFPFLICPDKTDLGIILPSKYWDKWLKDTLW